MSALPVNVRRSTALVALASCLALLFFSARRFWQTGSPESGKESASITERAIRVPAAREGYVGSDTCAKCHADVARAYDNHPMRYSAGRMADCPPVETVSSEAEIRADDGLIFQVLQSGGALLHRETLLGSEGEILHDETAEIAFFFGSGARGRSYAVDRGGLLFQSPISWYSRSRQWGLSPGYSRQQAHFGRRIQEGCVDCHAGRPTRDDSRDDYFPEPVLLEAEIGCERCHGPGERHVAFHQSPPSSGGMDDIVNPAKLDTVRREAVCDQCHLTGEIRQPRYGRRFGDFRPGDRLDDVWATFVSGAGVRHGKTKAVNHVLQLRESACFQKSGGRFGCCSCHDPHSMPNPEEKVAYYRARCLSCHADSDCLLPADEQAATPADNSCVHCHMPALGASDVAHVSQTDHRILARQEALDDAPSSEVSNSLVLFDAEQTVMPDWEVRRAKALVELPKLRAAGYVSADTIDDFEQDLAQVAEIAADDAPTWAGLATLAELRHDLPTARQRWNRVLSVKPNDELALDALAGICLQSGDHQSGIAFCDRLIELNPNRAQAYARRARLHFHLGREREAISDAELALRIDPLEQSIRRWLIDVYRAADDFESSNRHAEILLSISRLRVSFSSPTVYSRE